MNYALSQHAQTRLTERKIPLEWLERVLSSPSLIEADPDDSELEHRLAAIEEAGYRVLRVVCKPGASPLKIITLHFDRSMKGKL